MNTIRKTPLYRSIYLCTYIIQLNTQESPDKSVLWSFFLTFEVAESLQGSGNLPVVTWQISSRVKFILRSVLV